MENQENNSVKYYGLTFEQANETFNSWDVAKEFMRVVKVWGENSLSVYGTHIEVSTDFPEIMTSDCTEITREQFDEFYKKTVEKINKAATI